MSRLVAAAGLVVAAALTVAVAADDVELAWTAVPSEARRHGEVRVVRRGDETVVQTVLSSRVLRQVARKIADKERHNWPVGAPGHDDAERYVAALASAIEALSPVPEGASGEARRRTLLIEFVDGPHGPRVVMGEPQVAGDAAGRLRVEAVRPILVLEPPVEYVVRNQRLIVEDSFGLDEAQAVDLLGRAAPAVAPGTPMR